jgi:GDP-L-fucose synthase
LIGASSKELDLRNQQAVKDFMAAEKPEVIIDAAAKVGGILANNDFPYQFIMENMQIQNNLIVTIRCGSLFFKVLASIQN